MNFISVLSCFGLLLAAAAAQLPKPCVSPPLMTGDISVFSNGNYMTTGSLTYDAYGQKCRTTVFGSVGYNESFVMDQLMLFREKVYYEIDWNTFTCQKKPLDVSFVPMRVPEDAEFMDQYILGSSSGWGMGLLVNNWFGIQGNVTYISSFTDIGCIPLTTSAFGSDIGMTFVSTFNWVIGLSNPSDLSPPSFCSNAQMEESATPDNFFTALSSLAMKAQRED